MVETRAYELKIRYFIIIALLINFCIIFLFFFSEFYGHLSMLADPAKREAPVVFESPQPIPPPPMPVPQELAALKSRASVFGATDHVQEEAEFTPGTTDSQSQAEDASGQLAHNERVSYVPEQQEGAPKQSNKAEELEQAVPELAAPATVHKEGNLALREHKEHLNKEVGGAKIVEQEKPQQLSGINKRMASRNNTGFGRKNASPIKRELTFADLARGFLESCDHKGEDWIDRKGNENIRPDLQEMKYLCYVQKLYWHLQSIVKQSRVLVKPDWAMPLQTELTLMITRQGVIQQVILRVPSGCSDFDYYCTSLFQNNAIGCPPIPAHINQDCIAAPFTITLCAQASRIRFSYH